MSGQPVYQPRWLAYCTATGTKPEADGPRVMSRYTAWLEDRRDIYLHENNLYAWCLGREPEKFTAWLQERARVEAHERRLRRSIKKWIAA